MRALLAAGALAAAGVAAALLVPTGPAVPPAERAAALAGRVPGLPPRGAADGHVVTAVVSGPSTGLLAAGRTVVPGPGQVRLDARLGAPAGRGAWQGVGVAFTDSSVELLQGAPSRTAARALRLLADPVRGAGVTSVLLPQSSTDFSRRPWTVQDEPGGAVAATPEAERAADWARALTRTAPATTVDLSSWAPPDWLRDGDRVTAQGVAAWPQALAVRAAQLSRSGLTVRAVAVQNEPAHADPDYPTALWSAPQQVLGGRTLQAELARLLPPGRRPSVLVHEHNVDRAADAALLARALPGATVGWHCYAGSGTALRRAVAALPAGTRTALTECSGLVGGDPWADLLWAVGQWEVPGLAAGATSARAWNAVLDPSGGPSAGGCQDCRGALVLHPDGRLEVGPELAALAHLGRVLAPGSVLRPSVLSGPQGRLSAVAAELPDGSRALVAANPGRTDVVVGLPGAARLGVLPARSAGSWRWSPTR